MIRCSIIQRDTYYTLQELKLAFEGSKKRKVTVYTALATTGHVSGLVQDGRPEYDYEEMLARAHYQIEVRNPNLMVREAVQLEAPIISSIGTTRSCWENFAKDAAALYRDEEHLKAYVLSELGTTGSLDAKHQLIIKGRFGAQRMASLLQSYCLAYVLCENCKSLKTGLSRDHVTRLKFLQCNSCGSIRSVVGIESGY